MMGVGMPGAILLAEFGEYVHAAFGHYAYHVGSSLTQKSGWRDVDVRLILSDEEWELAKLGNPANPHSNQKWTSLTVVWSAFGKQLTGLPIDFQIQQRSHANATESGPRSALFRISGLKTAVACPVCGVCNCDHGALAAREVGRDVFSVIDGLTPVDPESLREFEEEMTQRVIPEIVDTMKQRARDAAVSRQCIVD